MRKLYLLKIVAFQKRRQNVRVNPLGHQSHFQIVNSQIFTFLRVFLSWCVFVCILVILISLVALLALFFFRICSLSEFAQ